MSKNKKMPDMPGVVSDEKEFNDDKPVYLNEGNSLANVEKVIQAPKSGIEVIATRNGFFNQNRRVTGDKFFVRKFEQLGEWMQCIDPVHEKRRVQLLKEKKAK